MDYVAYLRKIELISGSQAYAFENDSALSHAGTETIAALNRHIMPEMDQTRPGRDRGAGACGRPLHGACPVGDHRLLPGPLRNTQLVLQIADVYGVRPGLFGSIRLVRRVLANVATAAVTQQALHLFHVAYGATIAEAGGKILSGVGGAVAAVGGPVSVGLPQVGVPLAMAGEVIRHLGRGAGEAAEAMSGPLIEGLLTAALTVRVGLEAQQECRLFPMTDAEQDELTAGTLAALVGFFRRRARRR